MKRLPDFDGLRFVLCLGIACFHYSFRIPVKNEALQGFILTFAYFTDVFFIVSGLFLARRRNYIWDARHYVACGKRLARIYPLHVAAFSCYALLSILTAKGLLHPSTPPNMSWWDGLTQLLLIHDWGMGKTFSYNYVSWSLSALFFMYLAFPFFDLLCRRLGNGVLAVVVVAALGGEYLAGLLGASTITRIQLADIGVFPHAAILPVRHVDCSQPAHPDAKMVNPGGSCHLSGHIPVLSSGKQHRRERHTGRPVAPWFPLLLYLSALCGQHAEYFYAVSLEYFRENARYSFTIFILHPLVALFFFKATPEQWGDDGWCAHAYWRRRFRECVDRHCGLPSI